MGNAVIYIRVSSAEQVDGTSLDSQREICERCAKQLTLNVIGVFSDAGKSGGKIEGRDSLKQAIGECKRNKATLIVYKFDRLARNACEAYQMRDILLASGCKIVSATEGEANATHASKVLFGMMSIFAEFENGLRSDRTREGKRRRAMQGGWGGGRAPVGFISSGREGSRPVTLRPDGEKSKQIARLLTEYAYGAITRRSVKERLKDVLGVSRSTAIKILTTPIYGGIIKGISTDWAEVKACFDGIVSTEVWRLANRRYTKVKRVYLKNNPYFPLRGKLFCPQCGRRLTGGFFFPVKNGRKNGYYFCTRPGHYYIRREAAHERAGITVER